VAFAPVLHTPTCQRHARECNQIKSEALVKRDVYLVKRDVYKWLKPVAYVKYVLWRRAEACRHETWSHAGMHAMSH
jgi:GH35 family endo-1,4-beta-xylanase